MTACVMSIYQTCRELAGLTQEQAAEQLNTSVRTMARYESGEQAVPDDIAYQMVLLYDSPYLAVQHLRQVSQVAAGLLPPVTVLDLPRAAIRIINQVRRFADRHRERELLDIAENGVIAPEERPLFDEILDELREMVAAIMELGLSEPVPDIKKERPGAGTPKRSVFRTCVENDSKIIVSHLGRNASPNFCRKGGISR